MPEQEKKNGKPSSIVYSCYYSRNHEGEQFVREHVLSYQISGTLFLNDGDTIHTFNPGDFRFCKRNSLVKFNKQPPDGGEFKSVSIYLDQDTLRQVGMEYGYKADMPAGSEVVVGLKPHILYETFMNSLKPYEQLHATDNTLLSLKLREAVLILLQVNPEMKNILFDFSDPGKIDLEAFMNRNFHFNVELKRFAYLTGRSLATFKRDFEKIFHTSPSRWLQQRRLQEAHYLIKEKGAAPSDVYLELGFQDLSHFSFAFKKMYGTAPSRI